MRTFARASTLIVLQQAGEHIGNRILRFGPRYATDPAATAQYAMGWQWTTGTLAGVAVGSVGVHGFSYYHSGGRRPTLGRLQYMGAWALVGGIIGLTASGAARGAVRNASQAWGMLTGEKN